MVMHDVLLIWLTAIGIGVIFIPFLVVYLRLMD